VLQASGDNTIKIAHPALGKSHLYCLPSPPSVGPGDDAEFEDDADAVEPELLFTENDTNFQRLYGGINPIHYTKDAFHDHIVPSHRPVKGGETAGGFFAGKIHSCTDDTDEEEYGPRTPFPAEDSFVNPERKGTKAAAHYVFEDVPGNGGCAVVRLKLTPKTPSRDPAIEDEGVFDDGVEARREEADEFYSSLILGPISEDLKQIMRQGISGMLWTKQYYEFIQKPWSEGDAAQPPPPPERKYVRNRVHSLSSFSISPPILTRDFRSGSTCTPLTFCRCRTSGSTPSSRLGTPPSTVSRSRSSILRSPRSSSMSSLASGT
jgi:hypothetical protein